MNDMRAVIIPKSDQINADDLLGGPITITITNVAIRPGTEQPVAISFEGDNGKPYRPCKSMCRVMVTCWGPDASKYVGRSMTLYCDPKILWGGMAVGGIRISHMTDIDAAHTMALTATKGSKKPFTVQPLAMAQQTWDGPDPLDEPDGTKWLVNLDAALLGVADLDQLAAVRGHASVTKALAGAPAKIKTRIDGMLKAAGERLAVIPDTNQIEAPTADGSAMSDDAPDHPQAA
jgi:hypothetical protein